VVRAEGAAFEQRYSLKGRGYRCEDCESKRVKAWWLMTNGPQAELDWLRADNYGDDGDVTALKAAGDTAPLIAPVELSPNAGSFAGQTSVGQRKCSLHGALVT
jgi:hypothetical protein